MTTRTFTNRLLAAAACMIFFAVSATAAEKYWSGAGTWDTTSSNWGTTPGGPYTTAKWVDGDTAIFEGTAGAVALGETINISNLTINVGDYVISGNSLNFSPGGTISIQEPGWDGPTITCGITGSPTITDNTGYADQPWFANSYFAPANSTMTLGRVDRTSGATVHLGGTTTGNSAVALRKLGGGSIFKEGSGTWTVDGDCYFDYMYINGGTFVSNGKLYTEYRYLEINNGGTLVINGTFDPRDDQNTRLNPGGTMKGTGAFVGPTTAPLTVKYGAVLAPGDPTGTLTITNADCSIAGTLAIVVDGAQNSALAVDGNLDISAATSKLEVDASGALEDEYVIATYTTLTGGAFGAHLLPAGWSITYGANAITLSTVPVEDTTSPSINHNATSPADGEFGESPKASFVATFDEAIRLKSGGTITILDTDDGTGTRTIDLLDASQAGVEGNVLTLAPATELELDTRYEIVIDANAIEDLAGNPYPGTAAGEWNFTTCRDLENVLVCYIRLADAEPYKPMSDFIFNLFDNPLMNVDRAFRVASYGQMALNLGDGSGMDPTVELYYADTMAADVTPPELRDRARMDLVAMGYNLDNYRFIHYLIPQEAQWVGSPMAVSTIGGQWAMFREFPADTIMHEMAHLLGGQHGSANPSGVLAWGRINLSADKKLYFGMMDAFPGTVENLTSTTPSTTSLTLVPLSISHPTVVPGTRIVNIAEPDNSAYVISYHVSEAPYCTLASPELNSKKVFVNDDQGNTYSTVKAILGAGEVYTDGYLKVTCESIAADGLSAEVKIDILQPSAPEFTVDPISKGAATENVLYSDTIAGSATDADGDTLSYSKVGGPAWLSVATDGALSGTPSGADVGLNVFTVSVSDGTSAPVEATLNINVYATVVTLATTSGSGGVSGSIDWDSPGSFGTSSWHVKNPNALNSFTRKGYLRFDTSAIDFTVDEARIELVVALIDATIGDSDQTLYVYGITDQTLDEAVLDNTVLWTDAPANNVSSPYAADLTKAQLLGTLLIDYNGDHPAPEGTAVSFTSQALTDFINADTNGKVTFIIGRIGASSSGSKNLLFAGDTNTAYAAPSLSVQGQQVSNTVYALTVTGGTGGGAYTAGSVVPVAGDAPSPGYAFDVWTGDTIYLADPASSAGISFRASQITSRQGLEGQ